jgi:anti-anti-sigma factor
MLPPRSGTDNQCQRILSSPALDGVSSCSTTTAELTLSGELDLANCDEIVADVERLCRRHRHVRIDLGAVTFIDAAAVGSLLRAHDRARALGCTLALGNVHGFPLRLLQLLDLDTVLVEREGSHGH